VELYLRVVEACLQKIGAQGEAGMPIEGPGTAVSIPIYLFAPMHAANPGNFISIDVKVFADTYVKALPVFELQADCMDWIDGMNDVRVQERDLLPINVIPQLVSTDILVMAAEETTMAVVMEDGNIYFLRPVPVAETVMEYGNTFTVNMKILSGEELEKSPIGHDDFDGIENCQPVLTTIQDLANLLVGTECGEVGNTCFVGLEQVFGDRPIYTWISKTNHSPSFGDELPGPVVSGMPCIHCTEEEAEQIEAIAQSFGGSLRADGELEEGFYGFEVE
jgi:hypothetical protein